MPFKSAEKYGNPGIPPRLTPKKLEGLGYNVLNIKSDSISGGVESVINWNLPAGVVNEGNIADCLFYSVRPFTEITNDSIGDWNGRLRVAFEFDSKQIEFGSGNGVGQASDPVQIISAMDLLVLASTDFARLGVSNSAITGDEINSIRGGFAYLVK